jgi:hypothetical protein
VQLLEVTGDGV